ncbi:MAG: hypothetical protein NC048_06525 [Bacteroides sp.]|nr:hypothetical protein [Ruminococcus flavefaciens]MCM1555133.1 hypothetical protein [Bacteroides sp.]
MLRRTSLYLLACVFCMGVQRAAAQRVAWSDLPEEVVTSFHLAHPHSQYKIVHWELADMGYVARINLEPKEISSLFQANGEWVSTRRVVPESQLPLLAHDFISEKYAFYMLRSCTYEEDRWQGRHYYALFSIYGIEGYLTEVCFDMKGNVVSIDGKEIEDLDDFEPLTEEEVLRMQENELNVSNEKKLRAADRDLASVDTVKQQKKNRRAIYRPQTRRQFIAAKVSVQSKTAQQRMEREDSVLLAERPNEELAVVPKEVIVQEEGGDLALHETPQPEETVEVQERQASEQEEVREEPAEERRPVEQREFLVEEVIEVQPEEVVEVQPQEQELEEKTEEPVEVQEPQPTEPEEVAEVQPEIAEEKPQEAEVQPEETVGVQPEGGREEKPGEVRPKPMERRESMVSNMEGKSFTAAKISVKNIFPDNVQKAFNHRFPKAEGVRQYKDTSGTYRAIFTNFGQRAEAVILPDGTHTTTALFFGKKDVSYPIMQYILNSPEKYRFETGKRVVYESKYRQRFSAEEKPKNYYEIIVWVKDKATKERKYFMLTFDHKAHFVSKVPYDYSKLR